MALLTAHRSLHKAGGIGAEQDAALLLHVQCDVVEIRS